jgi:hypothetical protein
MKYQARVVDMQFHIFSIVLSVFKEILRLEFLKRICFVLNIRNLAYFVGALHVLLSCSISMFLIGYFIHNGDILFVITYNLLHYVFSFCFRILHGIG